MLSEADRFTAADLSAEAERTRTPAGQLCRTYADIETADSYAISAEVDPAQDHRQS